MPDGVIHRDIKPSNVLLDGLWTAKLSDVGLGKILSIEAMTSIRMSASRNMTSKIVGTFSYMDPEYISSGQASFSSDVYSLGMLMLNMITGKAATGDVTCRDVAEDAVEGKNDSFVDENAGQWPLHHALAFARLALRCAERQGHRRPDLEHDVLPALEMLYAECPIQQGADFDADVCVVCMDSLATHAFLPCGHKCVCQSEADMIMAHSKACPLCRMKATNVVRFF